ncbi:MAG: undecaprenyldiphospho-muramoylpentapeptide beta-N-acetylglucosaminyltransferase [Gammaproteobacteria bacterium]|nr:undecaprenyldiphospho-muramoylpentapeptide beta-N-acetylglucosaminyltransferase [Gammaproteobacteria bacterium]
MKRKVMIMAGGTGGHVYPALAVAEELRSRNVNVIWLGTPGGFEDGVVQRQGYPMEFVSIRGIRGNGPLGWLVAPFRIARAMYQASGILRSNKPGLVLGMGGFVSGPGGLTARLLRTPLVIHEQNAVPGLTNQWLSRAAARVMEAFPGSFSATRSAEVTGNPVRGEIAALSPPEQRLKNRNGAPRLLVLGGSQGARKLNETLPTALSGLAADRRPQVFHQTGRDKLQDTRQSYLEAGVDARVEPFIEDMADAYGWADLVLCRAGALTIAELAAAGVASILVPYPYAVDDHQTRNAAYLVDADAARLLPEGDLNPQQLLRLLEGLLADRNRLLEMARSARDQGKPEATRRVADICEETMLA